MPFLRDARAKPEAILQVTPFFCPILNFRNGSDDELCGIHDPASMPLEMGARLNSSALVRFETWSYPRVLNVVHLDRHWEQIGLFRLYWEWNRPDGLDNEEIPNGF